MMTVVDVILLYQGSTDDVFRRLLGFDSDGRRVAGRRCTCLMARRARGRASSSSAEGSVGWARR